MGDEGSKFPFDQDRWIIAIVDQIEVHVNNDRVSLLCWTLRHAEAVAVQRSLWSVNRADQLLSTSKLGGALLRCELQTAVRDSREN